MTAFITHLTLFKSVNTRTCKRPYGTAVTEYNFTVNFTSRARFCMNPGK